MSSTALEDIESTLKGAHGTKGNLLSQDPSMDGPCQQRQTKDSLKARNIEVSMGKPHPCDDRNVQKNLKKMKNKRKRNEDVNGEVNTGHYQFQSQEPLVQVENQQQFAVPSQNGLPQHIVVWPVESKGEDAGDPGEQGHRHPGKHDQTDVHMEESKVWIQKGVTMPRIVGDSASARLDACSGAAFQMNAPSLYNLHFMSSLQGINPAMQLHTPSPEGLCQGEQQQQSGTQSAQKHRRGPMDEMRQLIRILLKIFPQSSTHIPSRQKHNSSNKISENAIKDYLKALLGPESTKEDQRKCVAPPRPEWGLQNTGWNGYLANLFSWAKGEVVSAEEAKRVAKREPGKPWEARRDDLKKMGLYPEYWPIPLTKEGVAKAQKSGMQKSVASTYLKKGRNYSTAEEFPEQINESGSLLHQLPKEQNTCQQDSSKAIQGTDFVDQAGEIREQSSKINSPSSLQKQILQTNQNQTNTFLRSIPWDSLSELDTWQLVHEALKLAERKSGAHNDVKEIQKLIIQSVNCLHSICMSNSRLKTYASFKTSKLPTENQNKAVSDLPQNSDCIRPGKLNNT